MVEAFKDAATCRLTDLVLTRSVHSESYAVQQNHAHADPLKPRDVNGQEVQQIQQLPV